MLTTLVVLGATGDLTGRLLLPAVGALRGSGALDPDFRFVGAGHQAWTPDGFADHVRRRLGAHAPGLDPADRDALLRTLRYRQADVTEAADVAAVLAEAGPGPVVVYLALPTQVLLGAVRALAVCGLPRGSRVAVEKPFGTDAATAAELNRALESVGADTYRVDHALAMTAVQHLPRARLPGTDRLIDWRGTQIAQLDVLWEETLALEGRAEFYDRAGALRDVVQNHLLQLLCTIAGSPENLDPADRRAAVLRSVRPLTIADVRASTRRARYTAGRLAGVDGRLVPDYVDEDGVDAARGTETFAELTLELDTPRWRGTRVVLRAGKALGERRRGVLIHFRAATGHEPVWLDVDEPRSGHPIEAEPAAYEQLVADLLGGGTAFAVGAAEVELAWQVVAPVLAGWAADEVPLATYPAGSAGPR